MKKIFIPVALLLALICAITGMAACGDRTPLPVEDMEWEFLTLQDKDGNVICCAESNAKLYPDAKVADAEVVLANNTVTLSVDGEQILSAAYTSVDKDGERTTIYSLAADNRDCRMVSSLAKTSSGTNLGALLITVGENTYYFYAPLID